MDKPKHGPSFWKFNASLVNDDDFVALINESVPLWLEEFKDVIDKRLLWDLIKYRIRQITIKYSKEKARERRRKISDIEASLKISEERCGSSPTPENQEEFELLKVEYDSIYEQIAKGGIITSAACSLCGESDESLEHLFLSCHYTKNFWSEVIKWLVDHNASVNSTCAQPPPPRATAGHLPALSVPGEGL